MITAELMVTSKNKPHSGKYIAESLGIIIPSPKVSVAQFSGIVTPSPAIEPNKCATNS